MPTPPPNLPQEEPEPASTGSQILDDALDEKLSRSHLPFWHRYPWQKLKNQKAWTAFLVSAIRNDGPSLYKTVPGDIVWYCPRYPNLNEEERIVFWARFISILAEFESSYDQFEVTFTPGPGLNVYSIGLLMLSAQSARRSAFGCTMITSQADLFDWRKNLGCAVRIMNYFMHNEGAISRYKNEQWIGLARYWEPLREKRGKSLEGRQCIADVVRLRRDLWKTEGAKPSHPALQDAAYKAAGERRFERFLRLVNQLPLCWL
jgi:hypothetical protein